MPNFFGCKRCGRLPPEVRTAIPVDGRFEHIVLSCNATSDHAIQWIVRETEKALQRLKEESAETIVTAPPEVERMERVVSLNIPPHVPVVSAANEDELPDDDDEGGEWVERWRIDESRR